MKNNLERPHILPIVERSLLDGTLTALPPRLTQQEVLARVCNVEGLEPGSLKKVMRLNGRRVLFLEWPDGTRAAIATRKKIPLKIVPRETLLNAYTLTRFLRENVLMHTHQEGGVLQ